MTLSAAQAAAAVHGLAFGLDFGARDSATLGGIAATNAGGYQRVRFGTTRAQVMGIEAVLGSAALSHGSAGCARTTSATT